MPGFIKVATLSQLTPGTRMLVEYEGTPVGLFNIDSEIYAIQDVCTHDGGPVAEGQVDGDIIICPRHGARFNLKTGAVRALPAYRPVPIYQVKVEGNDILIAPKER